MKKILSVGLITLSMLLLACNTSKKTIVSAQGGSEMLYMSEWKLIEAQGIAVPSESKSNLVFTPGEINKTTGSTGCNRVNGTYVLSGDHQIKFGAMATTRMVCLDDAIAANEKRFLQALTLANNWMINEGELQLKNGNTIVARFKGQKPPTPEQAKLNGTWELVYMSGTKIALEGLFPNKKPTIIFNLPDELATGNGGCNGYSSKTQLDGTNIKFKDPLSTMMACEGNGEPVFFKALGTVTSFSLTEDNKLSLLSNGVEVLRFERK